MCGLGFRLCDLWHSIAEGNIYMKKSARSLDSLSAYRLKPVAAAITALLRTPARHRQSVSESSFDAWIKYYRQDENTPNSTVSYYTKGALVASTVPDSPAARAGTCTASSLSWRR